MVMRYAYGYGYGYGQDKKQNGIVKVIMRNLFVVIVILGVLRLS